MRTLSHDIKKFHLPPFQMPKVERLEMPRMRCYWYSSSYKTVLSDGRTSQTSYVGTQYPGSRRSISDTQVRYKMDGHIWILYCTKIFLNGVLHFSPLLHFVLCSSLPFLECSLHVCVHLWYFCSSFMSFFHRPVLRWFLDIQRIDDGADLHFFSVMLLI